MSVDDMRRRFERVRAAYEARPPQEPGGVPLAALQQEAMVPERYRGARLTGVAVAEQLRAWAKQPDGRALYLFGAAGRGKTYAMCALMNEILESGGSARFVTALALAEEARTDYGRYRAVFEYGLWAPLLFLDDVGAEYLDCGRRDAGQRRVADLLHERYDAVRATAITTNLSPTELAQHDARLASRVLGGAVVIPMAGVDRRLGEGR